MLEHPVEASVLAQWAVTIGGGRAISRKDPRPATAARILRDHTPDPLSGGMIWSDLHGDMKNQAETTWSPAEVGGNRDKRS